MGRKETRRRKATDRLVRLGKLGDRVIAGLAPAAAALVRELLYEIHGVVAIEIMAGRIDGAGERLPEPGRLDG